MNRDYKDAALCVKLIAELRLTGVGRIVLLSVGEEQRQ